MRARALNNPWVYTMLTQGCWSVCDSVTWYQHPYLWSRRPWGQEWFAARLTANLNREVRLLVAPRPARRLPSARQGQ